MFMCVNAGVLKCLISLNLSCVRHKNILNAVSHIYIYTHENESELNTKSGWLFNLSSCPGADIRHMVCAVVALRYWAEISYHGRNLYLVAVISSSVAASHYPYPPSNYTSSFGSSFLMKGFSF